MLTGKPEPGRVRRIWLECAVIFLFAALLIGPLWTLEYLDNWGSIESTFISDARLLNEQGWFQQWQPLKSSSPIPPARPGRR